MSQREFFINAVEMIDVQGSTNIPTVLLYKYVAGFNFTFGAK
jgi:hypothetical protein